MTEYATAITFPQTSTTYEAFSKLSAAAGQYGVRSAGIIERDAQGQLRVPESGDTAAGIGIASGSLIGMLVGEWRPLPHAGTRSATVGRLAVNKGVRDD